MPQSENWPFVRLLVDHLFKGTTRVWWQLASSFNDPQPHSFQLQAGYTGNPNALDWVDVGTSAVNAYYLNDDENREQGGKRLLTHYRVVLTTERGKYVSGPQGIMGTLSIPEWNMAREIIRKESLRNGIVSRPGYLLRKMRYGVASTKNTDSLTQQITDSTYPASWGTAFLVGYHPPVNVMADFQSKDITEVRGGADVGSNNSRPAEFPVRVLGFPDMAKEDIWVDATTDERWIVGDIGINAALRGVPLVYTAKMSLLPFTDVAYKIPVTNLSNDPTDDAHFQPTVGTGCVRVDHDFPENSDMVYQSSDCCGIAGASIRAYRWSDWEGGNRVPSAVVAASQTTTNGTWAWAMLLDPGDYAIVFEKPGEYGPDVLKVTVERPLVPPPSLESVMSSLSSTPSSESSALPAAPPAFADEFGQF